MGGVVNSIYLSKVAPSLRKGIKKGVEIPLTKEYLDERIDYFELYSILITVELWKQLRPIDEKRSDALSAITYDHLRAKRWPVSESLAFFQMNDKQMPEPYRLIGTLNYWLSMKREGKWESVKAQVEAADFSAKGMRYQLGLLSLQEKSDAFFAMVPRAIRSGDIGPGELGTFPVFEEMRRDNRMSRFTKGVGQGQKVATSKPAKGTPTKASNVRGGRRRR